MTEHDMHRLRDRAAWAILGVTAAVAVVSIGLAGVIGRVAHG